MSPIAEDVRRAEAKTANVLVVKPTDIITNTVQIKVGKGYKSHDSSQRMYMATCASHFNHVLVFILISYHTKV